MSLPLCLASKILNIKLFLFEPNMVLGRSNKFFIKFCKKIFCYSDKIKNFPELYKSKISIIPALLRKKFYNVENRTFEISKVEKFQNVESSLVFIFRTECSFHVSRQILVPYSRFLIFFKWIFIISRRPSFPNLFQHFGFACFHLLIFVK